jgi:hypothetical protein
VEYSQVKKRSPGKKKAAARKAALAVGKKWGKVPYRLFSRKPLTLQVIGSRKWVGRDEAALKEKVRPQNHSF